MGADWENYFMRNKNKFEVLIPAGYKPKKHELDAAWILSKHFNSIVQVLRPSKGYKEKTADFVIDNIQYELKTPTTSKVSKVEVTIREAVKQSVNVVIDMRKTKITEKRMIEICQDRLIHIKKLRKITLIVDKEKVLDFYKQM